MHVPARLGALSATAVLSLALAACGSGSSDTGSMSGMHHDSSSPTSSTPSASTSAPVDAQHDAADVTFSQGMVVHHQGAIRMAQMATAQASTPQVKDLAARIEAAQAPEIDEMTSWLRAWGEPVTAGGAMAGMDHSSGSTSSAPAGPGSPMGMMTDEQMDQLMAATGAGFDRMFLQMMTTHHQGAIAMARTEQADGSNAQAIALATSIESSQTAEVAEMARLLQDLGS